MSKKIENLKKNNNNNNNKYNIINRIEYIQSKTNHQKKTQHIIYIEMYSIEIEMKKEKTCERRKRSQTMIQ